MNIPYKFNPNVPTHQLYYIKNYSKNYYNSLKKYLNLNLNKNVIIFYYHPNGLSLILFTSTFLFPLFLVSMIPILSKLTFFKCPF